MTRPDNPSIAQLREVCQPPAIVGRLSYEHWAGQLYMRRLSLYLTRVLLRTPLTANGITWLMIASGIVAALVLTVPALWSAVAAMLLLQVQLLFDCSDGEVARWRETMSAVGVYLDKIGHYSTEAALMAALGVRADGGLASIDGWTTAGLAAAVLILMNKSETDLVHAARAVGGLDRYRDDEQVMAPRLTGLNRLRQVSRLLPVYRALGAIEMTILAVVAAIVDAVAGSLVGTQVLTAALLAIAAVITPAHLVSVLSSSRLR